MKLGVIFSWLGTLLSIIIPLLSIIIPFAPAKTGGDMSREDVLVGCAAMAVCGYTMLWGFVKLRRLSKRS
jgi:hypothetical protein